jgi:hypothetical protein
MSIARSNKHGCNAKQSKAKHVYLLALRGINIVFIRRCEKRHQSHNTNVVVVRLPVMVLAPL